MRDKNLVGQAKTLNRNWVSDKVVLRGFSIDDISTHFKFGSNYDSESERLRGHLNFPLPKEKIEEIVKNRLARQGDTDDFWWIIEDKKDQVIGNIRTFNTIPQAGSFSYGIYIEKKYWGKGYAQEALRLVCNYFFGELRYQKLTTIVNSFNERSILFHLQFGFKKEGQIRRVQYSRGQHYDHIYFGITVEEYCKKYGKFY